MSMIASDIACHWNSYGRDTAMNMKHASATASATQAATRVAARPSGLWYASQAHVLAVAATKARAAHSFR
jgi:hypothetical protein